MKIDELPPVPAERICDWLYWPEKTTPDQRPAVKWSSLGPNRVEFTNLTEKEREAIEAWLYGMLYLRIVDGRLHAYYVTEPLPDAEKDPLLAPHWESDGTRKEYGGKPNGEGWHSPSLIITALGAGITDRSPGGYDAAMAANQRFVESCGFECLRSRRSHSGKYWEQWVLHGAWSAEGPLKKHMDKAGKIDWHEQAETAARFMAKNSQFGSLDITIQRWALSCDD